MSSRSSGVDRVEIRVEVTDDDEGRSVAFEVDEVAVTVDGRRVRATDQRRGWTVSAGEPHGPTNVWQTYGAADIEVDAVNVLLPDDAEATGKTRDWVGLARALDGAGIRCRESDLAEAAQVVVFGRNLRHRLNRDR